jgi:hypothetical protein
MHLIENDPVLSAPAAGIPSVSTGSADWFVLMDAIDVDAASRAALSALIVNSEFKLSVVSTGTYRLMWDLSNSEIPA